MSENLIQKFPRFPAILRVEASGPSYEQPAVYSSSDISQGGLFVMTEAPQPEQTSLLVSVSAANEVLRSWARVAHVVRPKRDVVAAHPAGMGLEFAPLDSSAQGRLQHFLDQLAAQQPKLQDLRAAPRSSRSAPAVRRRPRYVGGETVLVQVANEVELRQIWCEDLAHGGLFIHSDKPMELHQQLQVQIETPAGTLSLAAKVVHVAAGVVTDSGSDYGVGLQFENLGEPQQLALQNYIAGRVPVVKLPYFAVPKQSTGPGFSEISGLLGLIFDGLERGDLHAALGLPQGAESRLVQVRLQEVQAQLATLPADATPVQIARVQSAVRTLASIEGRLKQRSIVWARKVGSGDGPRFKPGQREAAALHRRGDEPLARLDDDPARAKQLIQYRHLIAAIELIERKQPNCPPEDLGLPVRRALELMRKLDLEHTGARFADIENETRGGLLPLQPTPAEPRTRLLRALVKCSGYRFVVQVARAMVADDPDAVEPWRYLYEAYQRAGHRMLAERAYAQLQRLGAKLT